MADNTERHEIESLIDEWETSKDQAEAERKRVAAEEDAFRSAFDVWAESRMAVLAQLAEPIKERGYEVRYTQERSPAAPPADTPRFHHLHFEISTSPNSFRTSRLTFDPLVDREEVRVQRKLDATNEPIGSFELEELDESKVRALVMDLIRHVFR